MMSWEEELGDAQVIELAKERVDSSEIGKWLNIEICKLKFGNSMFQTEEEIRSEVRLKIREATIQDLLNSQ